jgi:hypothetical protein
MKITITMTRLAVDSGSISGLSQDGNAQRLATCCGSTLLERLLHLLDGAVAAGAADVCDLLADIGPILRQRIGQAGELVRRHPGACPEQTEREHHHHDDGRGAAGPPLDPRDDRRENKCEQHGSRERYEHRLRPIEHRDD